MKSVSTAFLLSLSSSKKLLSGPTIIDRLVVREKLFQGCIQRKELRSNANEQEKRTCATYHTNEADNEESNAITSPVITLSLSCKVRQMVALTLYVVTFIALLNKKTQVKTFFTSCNHPSYTQTLSSVIPGRVI